MHPAFALVLGLVLAAWLFRDRLKRLSAASWRWLGLAALVAAGIWLVATGKLAGLVAIAAGLAPWVGRALRAHALWKMVTGARRPREQAQPPPPRPPAAGAMSVDEAREVLGIGATASDDDIRAAHRRLMLANHPDHGGSTWIASRLNQARDVLLNRR